MRPAIRIIPTLLAMSLAVGCAHTEKDQKKAARKEDEREAAIKVAYAADAKENYEKGEEQLHSKNYLEALKFFEHVKSKYPYSSYAALADLRIADANFERDRFVEAIDGYKSFVKLHPSHPQVDYAAFQEGMASYKEIPSDFFLLPPSHEKDQTEVKNALVSFRDFTASYTKSEYLKRAQDYVEELKLRLARHELYVARFYERRDRWKAVVLRCEALMKDYADTSLKPDALLLLARAHLALKEKDKAREVLKRFLTELPGNPRRGEAEAMFRQAT